jgi:rhamnosyltransferase
MKNQVCAIFVSYNPSDEIIANVVALINQIDEVVIVDNASCAKSKEYLDYLGNNYKLNIIHNSENVGIATALNIGVKYARTTGCFWVATFDQDSLAPLGFIDLMLKAYEACNYKERVALISPRYFDNNSNTIYPVIESVDSNKLFCDIKTTLTSGNLVKLSVFETIGLFDDRFFIDYVDHEFCLRCLNNNYKIIMSSKALLNHELGNITTHSLFGRQFLTTNHSGIRRYYNARNRFFVYKKYLSLNPKWIFLDICYLFKDLIKILIFEHESLPKISYIIKGIYHAWLGKSGKYE